MDFTNEIKQLITSYLKHTEMLFTVLEEEKAALCQQNEEILSVIEKNDFQDSLKGNIFKKDILPDYIDFMTKRLGTMTSFRIAVDASNGVIGKIMSSLKSTLSVAMVDINFEPDGNFPNHSPNPLEQGSIDQIAGIIKKENLDFGFMFDGDADRLFLVDEHGKLVAADVTLLLLAKYMLHKNPGAPIAYNAICSRAVPEFVKQWGGVPIRTQVGFVNVRDGVIKNDGVMGGELSGHYCFKDYFYMDSGVLAFLTLLNIISKEGKKVSELVADLSPYFKSAETNFTIENKEELLEKIKQKYSDGKQDFLDGVTVEYQDWWFNVRLSNTEPLLRLTIEANTEALLQQKKQELSGFIQA